MKRVININFQGRVIPIEESAYDLLKKYIDSLTKFFANEEGREEIINDIEGRIAELFGEALKKGSTCVTDDDVTRIIDSMGRPEDFDDEENNVKAQLSGEQTKSNTSSSSSQQKSSATNADEPRRFYRDENHKVLGGVCSGIANYFGIDPVIVRVIFLVTTFGAGFGFLAYLILWVAAPSSASKVIGSQRKRLFRDPEEKIIAGVCSGLAQYFNISVWIPRLLFLIPFISFVFRSTHWDWWGFPHFLSLSFSPGALFIYIIFWLVIPEAKSTADKLEMKGEKVDLNNIKNTIQSDMEGIKERAEKFGTEVKEKAQEWGKEFTETVSDKSKQFSSEAASVVKTHGTGLGDIIVLIFKIFAYFVLGVVLFALVVALFSIGVVFTGLLPAKEYIIANGWQNLFAWGTLLLFVWVPVLGIVTFIIRRIAKLRGNSNLIRNSFVALWLLGLVCFIGLIASLRNDFRYGNHVTEQTVSLTNPKIDKLELTVPAAKYYSNNRWFKMEPFARFDEDTVFVQNVRVRIIKSTTDSFQVVIVKLANGRNKADADNIASKINYNITQKDSLLMLDKGIALSEYNKFRNQQIIVTIAVPVGKRIKVNENIGWGDHQHFGFMWDDQDMDWNYYDDQQEEKWRNNVEYIQTAKGLERVDKQSDDEDGNSIEDFKKSKEQILRDKEQKLRELKEIDKQLQDSPADSSKYHYQPDTPKKSEIKKVAQTTDPKFRNTDFQFRTNDLLLLKFYI
ncbi:MAG: PspC domain-containing protein [Bacteroidota bacterium]|nr:PspC domain-containing protein [Bacteroidota bacterium]